MLEPTIPPPMMMTSGDFKNGSLLSSAESAYTILLKKRTQMSETSRRGERLFGGLRSLLIGVAGERVQDTLEFHGAALLLEETEGAEGPDGTGIAQQFVDKEL